MRQGLTSGQTLFLNNQTTDNNNPIFDTPPQSAC
jgi:hypothetical protein